MSTQRSSPPRPPTEVHQIRSGDPWELSNGRAVHCAPTGSDGSGPNGLGFAVLDSDPMVKRAGVDTGVALDPLTLRAPDVAVNFEVGDGTWATKVPLAVEYAGRGQDEAELRTKIRELLDHGTQQVWVVRLVGPRRVEVHRKGVAMAIATGDDELTAPGVLALPVPVRALFDRDAAHEITLRNLLGAKGYASLDAVREEGREEGRSEGRSEGREEGRSEGREEGRSEGHIEALRAALRANARGRGWALSAAETAQVDACRDPAALLRWIERAVSATSWAEVVAAG